MILEDDNHPIARRMKYKAWDCVYEGKFTMSSPARAWIDQTPVESPSCQGVTEQSPGGGTNWKLLVKVNLFNVL